MKLFEYEAKNILQKYGIAVPRGKIAKTASEASAIAGEIGKPVFLKSQILVSGRGKAGGIQPASNAAEAEKIAGNLIGKKIKDILVGTLLVEEKLDLAEQLYASVTVDRQAKCFVVLASTAGGVDIEEVARVTPAKISRFRVDPIVGLSDADAAKIVSGFKLSKDDAAKFASVLKTLYKAAVEWDAELVEINPLAKTKSGDFIAADARMIVDDNAVFRHTELAERSLQREEDTPREAEARKKKLAYVDLDGDIGIIGNGAGLVMATLDLVQHFGGKPANFLDIGGGAQVEVIRDGVVLVMSKPEVKGVLINILGGITRCDLVAQGVVEGLKAAPVKKPIAVRMMGTNEKEGEEILRQNGIGSYPD
ncbi:MAG: ADP-forming succinate--CoA ligase subunit beta, partial [Dehalococcoidia bacterium]|nr:ADP-forming succinate--CoA ligase subunit beta [Dehalococcoidia bacterium]